jgi:hypothetical protein
MHGHPAPTMVTYAITAAVVGLVLFLRFRSMRHARPLRLSTLWIVPAVYAAVFGIALYEYPPVNPLGWLWLVVAVGLGAAIGWHRGKLMRISVDPLTGALNQQASPAAFLFIILLILARQGLKYEGLRLGINVMQVTGILMAFGLGLFTATRAEMYIRARRLLGGAVRA